VNFFYRSIALFFVFLNVFSGYSQCITFLSENFPPEIIESHREISFERNKEVYINQAKEDLKARLRADMSEKILSTVKSETTSEVVEVNDKFTSYFDAQVDIQSSSNLSYGNFDFCIDEKSRKVYGRFTIDKLKLAKANYADCLSALKGLIAEVNAAYNSGASVDATVYKKELDLLNSQKKTSIYLDSEVDVSSFEALYPDCQNAIAKLSQSQVQLHYESEMGIVSDSLGMERYNYAIRTLRKLQKQFRNDPVIQEELSSAESNYRLKLKRDVLLYESNARYDMALKEIDAYCSLLSCENEIKEINLPIND
jgi:hypothetical protein